MKKRVAIWCAVSSKPQAALDKTSLADQEALGRSYADRVGGEIGSEVVRVYVIPGHTRDLIFWEEAERTMDAYRELREDCEQGAFDVLWVFDPDRIGRDPALSHQVASLVIKSGAALYIETGKYEISDEATAARYIFSFQATSAGEDQKKRVERHHHGIRGRVRRGLHSAIWPYGYRAIRNEQGKAIGGEYIPDEIEAVRFITEQFLAGKGYGSIANALDESAWRPRRSNRWSDHTIRKIANNDFYAGYIVYGQGSSSEVRSEKSDKFPVLWDDETYRAVLRERKHRYRGGSPPATPVSGCVYCNRCGAKMVSSLHPYSKKRLYRCRTYCQSRGKECHCNTIYADEIMDAVDAKFDEWREMGTDKVVASMTTEDTRYEAELERKRGRAEKAIAEIERQQDRLTNAIIREMIDERSARRKNKELQERVRAALAALSSVEREIAALPNIEDMRRGVETLIGSLVSVRSGDLEEVRQLLLSANLHVWAEDGKIVGDIEIK